MRWDIHKIPKHPEYFQSVYDVKDLFIIQTTTSDYLLITVINVV